MRRRRSRKTESRISEIKSGRVFLPQGNCESSWTNTLFELEEEMEDGTGKGHLKEIRFRQWGSNLSPGSPPLFKIHPDCRSPDEAVQGPGIQFLTHSGMTHKNTGTIRSLFLGLWPIFYLSWHSKLDEDEEEAGKQCPLNGGGDEGSNSKSRSILYNRRETREARKWDQEDRQGLQGPVAEKENVFA